MSGLAELHLPVMLAEVVALLAPALEAPLTDPVGEGSSVLVDCTLGLGGHAHALLAACPEAQLLDAPRFKGFCLTSASPRSRLTILSAGSPMHRMLRLTCGWEVRS